MATEFTAYAVEVDTNRVSVRLAKIGFRNYVHAALYKALNENGGQGTMFFRWNDDQDIRSSSYDWVIGHNLDEEQFLAAICATIPTDGLAVNVG